MHHISYTTAFFLKVSDGLDATYCNLKNKILCKNRRLELLKNDQKLVLLCFTSENHLFSLFFRSPTIKKRRLRKFSSALNKIANLP